MLNWYYRKYVRISIEICFWSEPVFAHDSRIHHAVFNNFITSAIDMVTTRDCARTMTELITFFQRSSCYTLHVFQAIWNTETMDICYSCFAQLRLDILCICWFSSMLDLANVITVACGKIRVQNISYPDNLHILILKSFG